jgi:hypothetical protein
LVKQRGQCYFDEDTQAYEVTDEIYGDIPKKRTPDSRTYPIDEDTFKVVHTYGANYRDAAGLLAPCEPDIVAGSTEAGFDYSVEKTRFPVHISADGKRRHKPDRQDSGKSFDVDKPPLPGLGSPVVEGNKITWDRPGDYSYSVIAFPEGSKIEVTLYKEPAQKTFTFNTSRTGLNRAETEAFMSSPPVAWDANGNDVPLNWVVENNRVTVSMNDMGASYPVTIDPTVVIQPEGPVGDDSTMREDAPTTNYGSDTDMHVRTDAALGIFRAIKRFYLEGYIPEDVTLTSSTLSMYVNSSTGSPTNNIDICRLTQTAWTEAGVTWNKYDGSSDWAAAGGDYTETDKASSVPPAVNNWQTWTVTTLVQDALDNRNSVLDILAKWESSIEESATMYEIKWRTWEHSTVAQRPKLEVVYTSEQAYQGADADTYLNGAAKTTNYGSSSDILMGTYTVTNEGRRGLFKWDLSGELSASDTIDGAVMLVNQYGDNGDWNGKKSNAYRCTRTNWVEGEATWNIYSTGNSWTTAGGDYTSTGKGADSYAPDGALWQGWDCKDIVQEAVTNQGQVASIIIITSPEDTGDDYGTYRSTNYGTPADRPRLEVMYTVGAIPQSVSGAISAIVGVPKKGVGVSKVGALTLAGVAVGVKKFFRSCAGGLTFASGVVTRGVKRLAAGGVTSAGAVMKVPGLLREIYWPYRHRRVDAGRWNPARCFSPSSRCYDRKRHAS